MVCAIVTLYIIHILYTVYVYFKPLYFLYFKKLIKYYKLSVICFCFVIFLSCRVISFMNEWVIVISHQVIKFSTIPLQEVVYDEMMMMSALY